jgi:ParB/RepB/Spo0J family partition protein
MKIRLQDIHIGERLRDVNEDAAAAIAESFKTEGQVQAILVVPLAKPVQGKKWQLVAGAHRMWAAKSIGWTHLEATEYPIQGLSQDMAAIQIELAEIVENMNRSNLSAADAALSIKRLLDKRHERGLLEKKEAAEKEAAEAKEKERTERRILEELKRKKDAEEADIKKQTEEAERVRLAAKAQQEKAARASDALDTSRRTLLHTVEQNAPERRTGRWKATQAVAREMPILKTSSSTLRDYDDLARMLGDDVVKSLRGSPLDKKSELQALVKLFKKGYKNEALQCIKEATTLGYQKCSAVGKYGGLMAREKQAEKDKDAVDNAHNAFRHYQLVHEALVKARAAIREADGVHKMRSQIKGKFTDIVKAGQIIQDCIDRAKHGIDAHKGDAA